MAQRFRTIIFGKVENGEIVLSEPYKLRLEKRLRSLEGHEVEVALPEKRRKRSKRSLKQNSYYWAVVIPIIMDSMGEFDEEIVHDYLRSKFLKEVVVRSFINPSTKQKQEVEFQRIRSTTELSVGDFVEYVMKIEQWAIEFFGIDRFPDPDEWDPVKLINEE